MHYSIWFGEACWQNLLKEAWQEDHGFEACMSKTLRWIPVLGRQRDGSLHNSQHYLEKPCLEKQIKKETFSLKDLFSNAFIRAVQIAQWSGTCPTCLRPLGSLASRGGKGREKLSLFYSLQVEPYKHKNVVM